MRLLSGTNVVSTEVISQWYIPPSSCMRWLITAFVYLSWQTVMMCQILLTALP